MSSSNHPLRHGLGISKVIVLYVNTNVKLISKKQGDMSLCFLCESPKIGNNVTSRFQKIVNLSVCLVKIMVKWKGLENG